MRRVIRLASIVIGLGWLLLLGAVGVGQSRPYGMIAFVSYQGASGEIYVLVCVQP
jgi:hypothetical protein